MAQISEYQRQSLKSSMVGTPGADYSTGQAFDSVASAAGQVANVAFDLAVKRKAAKDIAVANESILSMDVDMENTWREHQETEKQFQGDPAERAARFRANAEKQVHARASAAPNDEVRRAIMEDGTRMIQSRTLREIEAADRNQGVIAYTKLLDAQKISEEEAARVGADPNTSLGDKLNRLNDLTEQSKGTILAASAVLDPMQVQQLSTDSPEAIMRAAATGMLAKNPEDLLKLLNYKDANGKSPFEGRMSPKEIEQLRKEAADSVINFQKRKEREEVEANLNHVAGAVDLAKRGDTVGALAMTESMADGPLKTSMRQSFLREGVTEADRIEKVYSLMTKFETFSADKTANSKNKKVNMKASLEELVEFQAEAIEAHATGDITDATRNKYLTEFLPALHKKAKNAQAPEFKSFVVEAALPWMGIKKLFPKSKEDAVTVFEDFQVRLAEGRDRSPEGVNKALIATLDHHRRVRFPKSIFISGSVNAVLDHEKSMIDTGVGGRTETPASGKVAPAEGYVLSVDEEGNVFRVYNDGRAPEYAGRKE